MAAHYETKYSRGGGSIHKARHSNPHAQHVCLPHVWKRKLRLETLPIHRHCRRRLDAEHCLYPAGSCVHSRRGSFSDDPMVEK